MKRSRLQFLVLVLVMLLPFTAVLGQGDDTVVIRGFGNLVTFNPLMSNDGASYQAYTLLFPSAIGSDSATGQMVPALTSWEISDDGLVYTFTINENANWSDGVPISSTDMKFSIEAIQSDIDTAWEPNVALIEEVNIIDEKTYEVVLSSVDCAALDSLRSVRFLPAHRFEPDFSDFETNIINTNPDISGGPYILEEWAPDEFQRFRANPDFWAGEPNIPYLINRVIGEQAVALQSIQAGEVDYTYFQGDLFEQMQQRDDLQWEIFPQLSVNFLSMNWVDPDSPSAAYDEDGNPIEQVPHPIFSDVLVRQAVAMGYNKADILSTMGGDEGGTILVGVVSPVADWAYNYDLDPYPYDPEAAGALLDEAGWLMNEETGIREKDGEPLAFTISYSDILLMFETTALVVQDQLGQIGFDVTLEKVEWANYISDIYLGQMYDATPMSNSDTRADPNTFTNLLNSTDDIPGAGNNLASYVNPEVDALIAEARSVPGCDIETRAELYREIQVLIHEDVAYDWTFVPNIWQTANSRIGSFEPGVAWVFYGYTDFVHLWTLDN